MLAFSIWTFGGIAFIGLGIYDLASKKTLAFGFWANANPPQIDNVKAYNRALGKLWCIFGIVFILFGIPLLKGQNSSYILISVVGVTFESIIAMSVYTIKIENKYRKKG